jgi:hypothetical protein
VVGVVEEGADSQERFRFENLAHPLSVTARRRWPISCLPRTSRPGTDVRTVIALALTSCGTPGWAPAKTDYSGNARFDPYVVHQRDIGTRLGLWIELIADESEDP